MKKAKTKTARDAPPLGVEDTTQRGFELVTFADDYGSPCSIQESSAAVFEGDENPRGWIWLGIDDPNPQVMKSRARSLGLDLPPGEVSGWMPYPIPEDVLITARMHLNEHQVRGLIARLQGWLDNGTLFA